MWSKVRGEKYIGYSGETKSLSGERTLVQGCTNDSRSRNMNFTCFLSKSSSILSPHLHSDDI